MPQRELLILVTGATDGIGRQTALELAQAGHRVIVHGRSAEKVRRTCASLEHETRRSVEPLVGDLSSLAAVRGMAAELGARFTRLDVLVHNAGVLSTDRRESVDGFELTFAVNHLAPFLLTALTLPLLRAAAPARVVTVSSMAHATGQIAFDDLHARRKYSAYGAYAQSKLANVLFALELAARHDPAVLTSNCLHPGVVTTKLLRAGFDMEGPDSLHDGATTSVYLATSAEVDGVTGRYFVRSRMTRPSAQAYDEAARKRLWTESEALTRTP